MKAICLQNWWIKERQTEQNKAVSSKQIKEIRVLGSCCGFWKETGSQLCCSVSVFVGTSADLCPFPLWFCNSVQPFPFLAVTLKNVALFYRSLKQLKLQFFSLVFEFAAFTWNFLIVSFFLFSFIVSSWTLSAEVCWSSALKLCVSWMIINHLIALRETAVSPLTENAFMQSDCLWRISGVS